MNVKAEKKGKTPKCCVFTARLCSPECYLLRSNNFCAAGGQICHGKELQTEVCFSLLEQDSNSLNTPYLLKHLRHSLLPNFHLNHNLFQEKKYNKCINF